MTKKLTGFAMLRERERVRRLVPAVVLRRRRAAAVQRDDPGIAVLGKSKRLSRRHAKMLRSLAIRSMGLTGAPQEVDNSFFADGLEHIKLDSSANLLITNAIRKISEILVFKMVATELVNDQKLRDQLVDMFTQQRFEMMKPKPHTEAPPSSPPADPYAKERDALITTLQKLLDV